MYRSAATNVLHSTTQVKRFAHVDAVREELAAGRVDVVHRQERRSKIRRATESPNRYDGDVVIVSVALGIVWNVVAVRLMGGTLADALSPAWLLAGAIAGVAAGGFTIWSRRRRHGEESIADGLATFYLGMFAYWLGFLIIQRVIMCVQHGGWTDFDLYDHVNLIIIFFSYGTVLGIALIPLCFLSRYLVWNVYTRNPD